MLTLTAVSAAYDLEEVLHDVTFSLPQGKNLGILGPNGCGKSTLLRAVAGLIPASGEILLADTPLGEIGRADMARRLALMGQMTAAPFPYTVYDTVMLGRHVHIPAGLFGHPGAADRDMVEACMAATGVSELRDRPITALSGGQLQRVFLAKTFAQEPRMILLDEPTNHLDLAYQAELTAYLMAWSREPERALVGVFHDINIALELSDYILVLKEGRVAAFGETEKVLTRALLTEVYGMDVTGHMCTALERWRAIGEQ